MSGAERVASMSPDELIAVITRGLDDDGQAARECGGVSWVAPIPRSVHVDPKAIADNKLAFGHLGHVATVVHEHDREHIARHDPSRVLADVEAKRELIRLYRDAVGMIEMLNGNGIVGAAYEVAAESYLNVLRALARPYLDQETP